MKHIYITGAGGLISSGIARSLKRMDKPVHITGNSPDGGSIPYFDRVIANRFGEPLAIPGNKFDLIIHCAFDKDDKSNDLNTSGTLKWAEDAGNAGIKKQLFLSSISSQSAYLSPYGKSKKILEDWFLERGHIVFRLGLVIANGGMFGRLLGSILNSPVVPLIGGGRFLVFPTDPETIYDLVYRISEGKVNGAPDGAWNLQYKAGISLKGILSLICSRTGRRPVFIPVPYTLVFAGLKLIEMIRLPGIDIHTGNLKGLKWNSRISLQSHLEALGYEERALHGVIKEIVL